MVSDPRAHPPKPAEEALTFAPIGYVRTPFCDKASAPRQPSEARGVAGTVELLEGRGFEDALDGVAAWSHLWILFSFHESASGWRPKVRPPRSAHKRGVFATRAPYRPNPIGLSVVRLVHVDGLSLRVLDVDMVDRTPVLDLKPYVAYTDSVSEAGGGWLPTAADPGPRFVVEWTDRAAEQRAFILARSGADVGARVETILSAGPEPHAYRRIRREADGAGRLAVKAWRFRFRAREDVVVVEEILTGYRARDLASPDAPDSDILLHRAFVEAYP